MKRVFGFFAAASLTLVLSAGLATAQGVGMAGVIDFGFDDGWVNVSGAPFTAGAVPPTGDSIGSNNSGFSAASVWQHTATGTTLSLTTVAGNLLDPTSTGPNGEANYEFTGTQLRSEFTGNGGNGTESSFGDFRFVRADVIFGSGVGANGFLSAADFINYDVSSQNGGSEAYEFGLVALRDENGSHFGSFNEADLLTYDPATYQQGGAGPGVTIGEHVTGVTNPNDSGNHIPGVFGYDGFNTTVDLSQPPAASGNPLSGSGDGDPTIDGVADFGLTSNDFITGFTHFFGLIDVAPNDPETGFSDTNTDPSGGFNGFEFTNTIEVPASVPEPGSLSLVGLGLLNLMMIRRRK